MSFKPAFYFSSKIVVNDPLVLDILYHIINIGMSVLLYHVLDYLDILKLAIFKNRTINDLSGGHELIVNQSLPIYQRVLEDSNYPVVLVITYHIVIDIDTSVTLFPHYLFHISSSINRYSLHIIFFHYFIQIHLLKHTVLRMKFNIIMLRTISFEFLITIFTLNVLMQHSFLWTVT